MRQLCVMYLLSRVPYDYLLNALSTIDFENLVGTTNIPANYDGGTGSYTSSSSGLTTQGVQFVGNDGLGYGNESYIVGSAGSSQYQIFSGSANFLGGRGGLTITLPNNITALGFDYGRDSGTAFSGGANEPFNIEFTFSDASTLLQPSSLLIGQHLYLGIVGNKNISSVTISNPGMGLSPFTFPPYTMVDNFSFGSSYSTPLPATIWLFASGLVGLRLSRSRNFEPN